MSRINCTQNTTTSNTTTARKPLVSPRTRITLDQRHEKRAGNLRLLARHLRDSRTGISPPSSAHDAHPTHDPPCPLPLQVRSLSGHQFNSGRQEFPRAGCAGGWSSDELGRRMPLVVSHVGLGRCKQVLLQSVWAWRWEVGDVVGLWGGWLDGGVVIGIGRGNA